MTRIKTLKKIIRSMEDRDNMRTRIVQKKDKYEEKKQNWRDYESHEEDE
jgi:hypothetical protein